MRPLVSRLLRVLTWLIAGWFAITIAAVLLMRWIDPFTSAFILRERIIASTSKPQYAVRQQWVDWAQISPQMKIAVIASEDQTFPDHYGFDFKSINKALDERESGRRVRGASTISQQVAKNLFLWSGQSWARKALEAWFTIWIEMLWPKQRILEVYLNVAQFGRGTWGIEAASRRYFGKPAARLTRYEAALLAAVLPSPTRYRVVNPGPYVRERQQWIVGQMGRLGGPRLLEGL